MQTSQQLPRSLYTTAKNHSNNDLFCHQWIRQQLIQSHPTTLPNMQYESSNTSLGFSIGNYEAQCRLQDGCLRLRVNNTPIRNQKARVSLLKMLPTENGLQFWLSASNAPQPSFRDDRNAPLQTTPNDYNLQNDRANQRLSLIEQQIREMQTRILNQASIPSPTNDRVTPSDLRPTPRVPLTLAPTTVLKRQEKSFLQLIEKQVKQNMRLQLLAEVLHERLTKRELNCRELQSKLVQKQELTMELAQKFISANQQKDQICNEYDRILQTTVFSRPDERATQDLLLAEKKQDRPGTTPTLQTTPTEEIQIENEPQAEEEE